MEKVLPKHLFYGMMIMQNSVSVGKCALQTEIAAFSTIFALFVAGSAWVLQARSVVP